MRSRMISVARGAPATERHRHLVRIREHARYLDRRIAEGEGAMLAAHGQQEACTWFIALYAELRDRGALPELDQAVQERIRRHEAGDTDAVLW